MPVIWGRKIKEREGNNVIASEPFCGERGNLLFDSNEVSPWR